MDHHSCSVVGLSWFKFTDVSLYAPCSLATPHIVNLQENGGFIAGVVFYSTGGMTLKVTRNTMAAVYDYPREGSNLSISFLSLPLLTGVSEYFYYAKNVKRGVVP